MSQNVSKSEPSFFTNITVFITLDSITHFYKSKIYGVLPTIAKKSQNRKLFLKTH